MGALAAGALLTVIPGAHAVASPAVSDLSANPDPVVMAVGDIACDPNQALFRNGLGTAAGCRQQAVADAVRAGHPDLFLPLGDNQYFDGRLAAFMGSYDRAFGDLKSISRPIPGNHEYKTIGGAGYYAYFGPSAHQESRGTYSFDVGSWHVLAINSVSCDPTHSCGPGSPMARWIAGDIANHPASCVMAMWHHPVWSAGAHGGYLPMVPVWNQLNSYGVDLVLNGHDHLYQRFKPAGRAQLDGNGTLLPPTQQTGGMTEMVIGTGGEDNYGATQLGDPRLAAALAAYGTRPSPAVFGAQKLTLHDGSFDFEFAPAAGTTFGDAGSGSCRAKTPPSDVPPVPRDVTVARAGDGAVNVSWSPGQAKPGTEFVATATPGIASCRAITSSCRLTGLANGRSYRFRVTASNQTASSASEWTTPLVAAMHPSAPSTPVAVPGFDSAAVSWRPPAYDGGLPVTGYTVTSFPGGRTCLTSQTNCTITGLTPGTVYRFTASATNEVGTSLMTAGSAPVRTSTVEAPTVSSVARAGDGAARVAVQAGPTDATNPGTIYKVVSAPGGRSCLATETSAMSCTVQGLTNGITYRFSATTSNLGATSQQSPSSAPIKVGRVSTRPLAVVATPVSAGMLSVSWNQPTWDGGLEVDGFTVNSTSGGLSCSTTGATRCLISGAKRGQAYSFVVAAHNAAGSSAPSTASAAVKGP